MSSPYIPEALKKRLKKTQEKTKTQANTKITDFNKIKEKILKLFNDCPLINISTIPELIRDTVDYKNAICPKKHTGHNNLTAFLQCCSDICDIIRAQNTYILCNSYMMSSLINKRIYNHIERMNHPQNSRNYHFEVLLVNMFANKTTITPSSLKELFYCVYKRDIESLSKDFVGKIKNMNSLNMFVKQAGGSISIRMTPTHSPDYVYYGDVEIHKKVVEMEKFNKTGVLDVTKPSDSTENMQVSEHKRYLDLNIPKSLSIKQFNSNDILEMCTTEKGLTAEYFLLVSALNIKK